MSAAFPASARRQAGLSLLIGLLLVMLALALWWGLSLREQARLKDLLANEAAFLTAAIEAEVRGSLPTFQRMALRWERGSGTPAAEFAADAADHLADMPGIQAIEWVDRDYVVRWVVPLKGNENVRGRRLVHSEARRKAVNQAVRTMKPAMSSPVELVQGGLGLLVYFPLRAAGQFDGFIVAVVRLEPFLASALSHDRHHDLKRYFQLEVLIDGQRVIQQPGWVDSPYGNFQTEAATTIMGHEFSVRLRPTAAFIAAHASRLPEFMVLAGLTLSLLLSLIVHLLQKSLSEARSLSRAKLALENSIAERHQTEQQLAATLARMDLATRAGGIGLWTWDIASGSLSWNEQMYALFGLPTDLQPTYDTWRAAVHPDDLAATEDLLQRASRGQAIFNDEFRIRRPDGTLRYLTAAARMERDGSGRPIRMNGINWDITEWRLTEQALKESEEKFRVLTESSPTAVMMYQDDRWIYANPAAEALTGYSRAELRDQFFWEFIAPEDQPRIREIGAQRQSGQSTLNNYDIRIVTKNGEIKWVNITGATAHPGGRPAGILSIIDMTPRRAAEQALRSSEEQVRLLLNSTGEAIYGIDLQGCCTFANPACLRLTGYSDIQQLLGRNMHDLIHHSFADGSPMPVEVCRIFKAYREGARMHVDDEVLWRADGSSFPAEYWSYPQLRDGQVVGAVVTFIDISERRATEAALVRERQRLGYILEGTNVGTWEWNVQTGETVFNDRWAGMLGFNLAELEPTSIATWKRFAHPDDLAASTELLEKHFRGELAYYECEARLRHRSGEWIWVLDRGKVATWTSDGQPLLMCGTHQDITARKLAEEKIRHLANHDVLTDLPSLRLAKDRLNVALNAARRNQALVAVLFIDLDGFKQINDSFGHETGDCVLRQVAGRLSACGRGSDTVARIGGDEFLGLAAGLSSAADAAILAERMLESLTKPMACGERQATVGASIGIALYPIHASTTEDLIRLADEAMYRTKASGKNAYSFAE